MWQQYFYPIVIALLDLTAEYEVIEVITQANESKGMITRLYSLDISSIGAYIE
jgi:hypothetical protein